MSSVLAGLRRFGSDGTDGQLTLMLWSEEAHYCRTKGGWHARRPSCHPFARPHTDPTGGLRPEPSIGLEIHIFGVHFPSRRVRVRERKLSQGTTERSLAPRTQKRLVHAAACGASASQHDRSVCVRDAAARREVVVLAAGSYCRQPGCRATTPVRLPRRNPSCTPVLRPSTPHGRRRPGLRAPRSLRRRQPASAPPPARAPPSFPSPPPARLGGLAPGARAARAAPPPPAPAGERATRRRNEGPRAPDRRCCDFRAAAPRDPLLLRPLRPGFETDSRAPDAPREHCGTRGGSSIRVRKRARRRATPRLRPPSPHSYSHSHQTLRILSEAHAAAVDDRIEGRSFALRAAARLRFHPDSVSGSARAGVRSGLRAIDWVVGWYRMVDCRPI